MSSYRFILVILALVYYNAWAQTALLKAPMVFPDMKDTVNFIKFKINGQQFGEKDTVIRIHLQKEGWDRCEAIIHKDTIRFLTKFKDNEYYEIQQGCCCAAFVLGAVRKPKRGTIKFKNTTFKPLGIEVGMFNVDTVNAGSTHTIFANESPMCFFKPCQIMIVKPSYFSDKYNYSNSRKYKILQNEQESLILKTIWFNFLHGEKIEVLYHERNKKLELKLLGYLTDEEYAAIIR